MRLPPRFYLLLFALPFPRLRAGTFIEARIRAALLPVNLIFPRLRAGTFIEADPYARTHTCVGFPRLRAGTFIEAKLGRFGPCV